MDKDNFADQIWDYFALRKSRDYLVKPLFMLSIILLFSSYVEFVVTGGTPTPPKQHLMVSAIVAIPFLTLSFFLITRLDRLKLHLSVLAATDPLTNVPNRRSFLSEAGKRIAGGQTGMIALIDADHFKQINDSHGHAMGDSCLLAIAERLRENVRSGDLIGRLGGEEFGIFFADAIEADTLLIADRLTRNIDVVSTSDGSIVTFTLSIGVTKAKAHERLEDILSRADDALYSAKVHGRARMVFWNELKPNAA